MIDIHTYKELHPEAKISKLHLESNLTEDEAASATLPSTISAFTFPAQIMGYSLARKTWGTLTLYAQQAIKF